MLNIQTNVKTALDTVLTTYLDQFQDSRSTPCITIMQVGNNIDGQNQGDTLAWSRIYYDVKLYAGTYQDIATYSPQIDTAMRGLGFVRRTGKESIVSGNICMIYTYELLTKETF